MRVQLQIGTETIAGRFRLGLRNVGVTGLQMRQAMLELNAEVVVGNKLPARLEPQLAGAIARTSQWITRVVTGGGVKSSTSRTVREELVFDSKRNLVYRLDTDNLRGHNLRR